MESASATVRHKHNVLLKSATMKHFQFVMGSSASEGQTWQKGKIYSKPGAAFHFAIERRISPFLKVCIQAFCGAGGKFVHTQGCAFVDLPSFSFFSLFFLLLPQSAELFFTELSLLNDQGILIKGMIRDHS